MIAERILHEYVFWQRSHSHGALRFVSLHSCIIIATHGFLLEYNQIAVLGRTYNELVTSHTITASAPSNGLAHYLWDAKGTSGQVNTLFNQSFKCYSFQAETC